MFINLRSAISLCVVILLISVSTAMTASAKGAPGSPEDKAAKFRQLGTDIRSPNIFRNAAGAPGPAYWQQKVDYDIDVMLDEDKQRISGSMQVTYTNKSPDTLRYLWLALDQNRFVDGSYARASEDASSVGTRRDAKSSDDSYSFAALKRYQAFEDREYGFELQEVHDAQNRKLDYTVNNSMMRIELPKPLKTDERFVFYIDWEHNIIDEKNVGGRGGYEYFPDDKNYIFAISQWFPRLAAYTDYTGWQNKQFLGRGEFTLEFGDYTVNITVPSDHVVSATGILQNARQVMTTEQRSRLDHADDEAPIFIITPQEAAENEKGKSKDLKTWRFKAQNVRDFSWASSRKFIWDAMVFKQDDDQNPEVMAMSFYPKEAEPIWSKFSTIAVIHTMSVYNRFAFNYPYPVAQSVNAWERGGMEYPMITFNGYRPSVDEDTDEVVYSRGIKYGLIGVIIHEIGHIYFPMTVNSDERRWTWMDEGINTFLQYMAEYEWEENFPIRNNMQNPLDVITSYMRSSNQVPIMTQSDSTLQFGSNAYIKPAVAMIVLRETVMGRDLFDYSFREYATRWRFKRPTPADFFRTMEDASAVDLDWFWRGWFFSTDHVDMAITDVRQYQISTRNPDIESVKDRSEDLEKYPENIVQKRNREEGRSLRINTMKSVRDLYNEDDKFTPSNKDYNTYQDYLDGLSDEDYQAFTRALDDNHYLYFIDFENVGGLISPLPLHIEYVDGATEDLMLPAELWRRDSEKVSKLLVLKKPISSIELDIAHQTADADYSNNAFPQKITRSRLEVYKSESKSRNLMQEMLVELKGSDKDRSRKTGPNVKLEPTDIQNNEAVPYDRRRPEPHTDEQNQPSEFYYVPPPNRPLDEDEERALKRTMDHMLKQGDE